MRRAQNADTYAFKHHRLSQISSPICSSFVLVIASDRHHEPESEKRAKNVDFHTTKNIQTQASIFRYFYCSLTCVDQMWHLINVVICCARLEDVFQCVDVSTARTLIYVGDSSLKKGKKETAVTSPQPKGDDPYSLSETNSSDQTSTEGWWPIFTLRDPVGHQRPTREKHVSMNKSRTKWQFLSPETFSSILLPIGSWGDRGDYSAEILFQSLLQETLVSSSCMPVGGCGHTTVNSPGVSL